MKVVLCSLLMIVNWYEVAFNLTHYFLGSSDIHVIGFSLGGQVPNYISNYLKPDFLLPRITGLGELSDYHHYRLIINDILRSSSTIICIQW